VEEEEESAHAHSRWRREYYRSWRSLPTQGETWESARERLSLSRPLAREAGR